MVTVGLSGVRYSYLINDVVCVALAPLELDPARRMKFDPFPHLIGVATAPNEGLTSANTGNPQNIYIGAHSGISCLRFAARLLWSPCWGWALPASSFAWHGLAFPNTSPQVKTASQWPSATNACRLRNS